jgi:hypothetical protein
MAVMSEGGYELEAEAPKPVRPPPVKVTLADASAASRARGGAALKIRPLCPSCGYDLTGARPGVCPECGKKVTEAGIRHAAAARARKWYQAAWVGAGAMFAAGLALTCGVWAWEAAQGGDSAAVWGLAGGVLVLATVVIACAVYFGCAMLWIGWDQNVPTTMLQVAGVFGLSMGVAALLDLVPVPVLPWVASVLVLIGLMVRVMDIEVRDAVIVAVLVAAVRWIVTAAVVAGMLA